MFALHLISWFLSALTIVSAEKVFFCFNLHLGHTTSYSGSSYTVHQSNKNVWHTWSVSRQNCIDVGLDLVSIESREEWNFLNQTIQPWETGEYFIGLRKDVQSGDWRWISDNSTVNASTNGAWPWATGQPNNNPAPENCGQMYKDYKSNYGRYNDVGCNQPINKAGYICEGTGESNVKEGR